MYCKNYITGPCSKSGPFPSLDGKNADFSSKFLKKIEPLIKAHPRILKKNRSFVMQKHLQIVISSDFLVVRLQRSVPLNKVNCFLPYFHFVPKYQPSQASCEPHTVLCPGQCIFKVLSIPSVEITVYLCQ